MQSFFLILLKFKSYTQVDRVKRIFSIGSIQNSWGEKSSISYLARPTVTMIARNL